MQYGDLKIFTNIPTMETERLFLRRIRTTDLDDVNEYASDPEVPRYLLWHPHQSRRQTADYLKIVDKKYKRAEYFDWGIVFKEDGHLIGTVGFTSFDVANDVGEIGYVLNSKYWGRGIATEAVKAVITFGFEILKLNRVEAQLMPENEKSAALLQRCSLRFEGIRRSAMLIKGNYSDIAVYSITADEYKKITSGVI